jgi:hypothetical protein
VSVARTGERRADPAAFPIVLAVGVATALLAVMVAIRRAGWERPPLRALAAQCVHGADSRSGTTSTPSVMETGAMRVSFLIPLVAGLSLACASQAGVQNAPLHAGFGRTFTADYATALRVSREAALESGLKIESATQVDPTTYIIMCKASTSAWSWGEIVRLAVLRETDSTTTVRVYSKRKSSVNIAAKGDYSESILSNIELKLASQ